MRSNNSVAVRIGAFLFVVVVICVSGFLWWRDGVAPVNSVDTSPIVFTIQQGEGIRNITTRLAKDGLIRSPVAFFVLIKVNGYERRIQAGEFRLNRSMNASTVADTLTHGVLDTWITIVEGWRVEEVASKLSKELAIPETEFIKNSEEGYMFPDTYAIQKDASAAAVAAMFRQNFDRKVAALANESLEESGLTMDEVVILASIVEREGNSDDDRPLIAGILLNRLELGMPLQADATLQYSLGYQPNERSWWKKVLTNKDKDIVSPYNTYRNVGLPPNPICNPGLSSIRAVFQAKDTPFLYYLHDRTGQIHYAETLDKHNANIVRFLN
jgi:UPF0755 protein